MQPSKSSEAVGLGRARRVLAAVAKTLGLVAVFMLAAAGGAVLHLGLGAPRRFAARQVSALLARTFKGQIVVRRIGALHVSSFDGVDGEVFDPEDHRVLLLRGVHSRFATFTMVRSLLGKGPLIARIPELNIDDAEVVLEEGANGDLGLARAFDSRTPSTGGAGADVTIAALTLHHAWIHGHMPAAPLLDADLDAVSGTLVSTPDTTQVDVAHAFVRDRGHPGMNPEGRLQGSLVLPAAPNGETKMSAHFDGQAGAVALCADASLQGKLVNVVADVPETAPLAFNSLAPGVIHLAAPVSAHAEMHGELPILRTELHAHVGAAALAASAVVTLPERPRTEITASVSVGVKDLDLGAFQDGAPSSRLDAALEATVISRPGAKVSGTFHLASALGEAQGQVVPSVDATGEFTQSTVRGSARIAEHGVPTTVRFSLSPRPGGESPDQLAFSLDASAADLNDIPRLRSIGRGRARVAAEGWADLQAKIFSARAKADLDALDVKGVRLAHAMVTASADGPYASPHLAVRLLGADLGVGGYVFSNLGVTARGTPVALDVSLDLMGDDHVPTVGARARIIRAGDLVVRDARIQVARYEVKSTTNIASVRVGGDAIDVSGLRVDGLGDPISASARIATDSLTVTVKAKAPDIELSRVAALLAREEHVRGHLSFDIDAIARRAGLDGRLDARVRDLSLGAVDGVAAHVSAIVAGRHLAGGVSADLGKAGKVELSAADVTLGGAATDPRAWTRATGVVTLDGQVDLKELLAQTPAESRPLASASGVVTLQGKAARLGSSASPVITLAGSTAGLSLEAKQASTKNQEGSVTLGHKAFTLSGVDATFSVRLAPTTGSTQVSMKIADQHGPLVSLDSDATLPLARIFASPSATRTLLVDAPLEAKIAIPRRALDSLPPALGLLPVKGDVELTGELRGSARAPKLSISAKGTNVVARDATTCASPLDLEAKIGYDGATATAHLRGVRGATEIVAADTRVAVIAAHALAGGPLTWEASGDVALTRFPLDALAPLLDRAVSGEVSGRVTLGGLHEAATVDAELDVRALALDHATFPRGKVRLTVKDGALTAAGRLDQTDGFLDTKATSAISWGAAVAPGLDLTKPIDVSVTARNFRADAAMPFVRSIFSELDGRVDADAQLHVNAGGKDGNVKGAITLRGGSFEVPQLGERFHGIRGKVVMNPWGTLKFEDFAADAATGHVTASGDAQLHGLALQTAAAQVHIADGQSIPIALEGVPMGRAFGDVKTEAKLAPDGKRLDVDVDIPMLHVALPQSTGHTVQPLELDETVRVGRHGEAGDFIPIPLVSPTPPRAPSEMVIHAAVTLGRDVEVKRDTTVDAVAHGAIDVLVTDKARLTGKILVDRGKLELEGKLFTIDRGTVTFLGNDPSNPMVVATAYWDAPDQTRVYADFSGLVSSGKLVLRSEPALSQDEILSLVLFGSPDGSLGAQPPPGQTESTGAKAAGMGGSFVTEGLNKAISGVTSVDISTRVDTSEADNPQPEVAVQLTKTVSARLGYKLGVPAPGENPDRTEVTLDWRFVRQWSLVAVVGDQGSTALDVVWRMRY